MYSYYFLNQILKHFVSHQTLGNARGAGAKYLSLRKLLWLVLWLNQWDSTSGQLDRDRGRRGPLTTTNKNIKIRNNWCLVWRRRNFWIDMWLWRRKFMALGCLSRCFVQWSKIYKLHTFGCLTWRDFFYSSAYNFQNIFFCQMFENWNTFSSPLSQVGIV